MSEPALHSIETAIHGHFLVREAEGDGPSPLLVGFHGYGETARDHFDALVRIPGVEAWTVCAPQGLRDFYRRSTGEVVAGWMTRFQRELAITDNLRYVGSVVAELRRAFPRTEGQPLVFAGFSQGVAMTYRAAARSGHAPAGVVALAGDVPPELAEGGDLAKLAKVAPVLIGRGTEDRWYDEAKLAADVTLLEGRGARVETLTFEGGHEWGEPFLERAGRFLAEIRAGGPSASG